MHRRALTPIILFLYSGLLLSRTLLADVGPQLVATPTITYLSYSYVRIAWTTNVPSNGVILYGTTNAYGQVTPAPGNSYTPNYGYDTPHSWFISGLAPSTTFHYCIQSTDQNGNVSTCNGTTNDFTFTTPAAPNPAPQQPQAPLATVDITEPTQTGRTWTVNTSGNCADPSTGLQATLNAANPGDTVVIPHGAVCDGVYNFPAKTSGTGWIVVKSDGLLPPAGTRITPAYLPQMATIRTSRPAIRFYNQSDIPNITCYGGVLAQEIEARGLRPGLHTCIASQNIFSPALPYTSGTAVPATCTEGAIFYNTATAAAQPYQSTYQCVNDNGRTHFVPLDQQYDGPYELTAGIQFAGGANHYRLIGLEVTFPPVPSTYTALGGGIYYGSLISLPTSSSNIVLDRLYVHGQDFPAEGPNAAIYFDGSSQALINCYVDQISYWMPTFTPERYTSALMIQDGPGPGRIQNNYLSAIGITVYVSESKTTTSPVPSDYQVFGNYFFKDDKYRLGSPTNISLEGGRYYGNRHSLEFKEGHRWSVQGNIFSGNFAAINQGASVAVTSSPADNGTTTTNDMQVSDIDFSNNIFTSTPQGFVFAGTYAMTTTNGAFTTPSPKTVSRIRIDNNLFYQLDSSLVTNPAYAIKVANAIPFTLGYGAEDFRYSHNTSYCNSRQDGPLASFFSAPLAGAGLAMNDNVACFGLNGVAGPGVTGVGSVAATALNVNWNFYPGFLPAWQFTNNVIYGDPTPGVQPNLATQWAYPTGNFWPANDTAVGFNNAAAMDMGLTSSSPYKGLATDGTDPGVDMVRLAAATSNTQSGINYVAPPTNPPVISGVSVTGLNQSSATIIWSTDVKSDSQVAFGLTGSYGSYAPFNPALGVAHSVILANLSPATTYHYQVKSRNAAGNLAVSADAMFTTAPVNTTAPTVLSYNLLFGSRSYNLLGSSRKRVPWQVTGIQVVFSAPITTGNLNSISGVVATNFTGLGTNTLTWTINPLALGSFTAVLAGTGANALKDANGNALGTGAGFSQTIKVLWADANDDGVVNSQDQVLVNANRTGVYNIFDDLNGDGVVDTNDVMIVRSRTGTSLP